MIWPEAVRTALSAPQLARCEIYWPIHILLGHGEGEVRDGALRVSPRWGSVWFWCCAFSARALCVSRCGTLKRKGFRAATEKDENARAAPVGRPGCGPI